MASKARAAALSKPTNGVNPYASFPGLGQVPGHPAPVPPQYQAPYPQQTELPSDQERAFVQWVHANHVPFNAQSVSPTNDYDMRGFYKALTSGDPRARTGVNPSDEELHFTDAFKTPYHKTFSDQSMYAAAGAPSWQGDKLVSKGGKVIADETPLSVRLRALAGIFG